MRMNENNEMREQLLDLTEMCETCNAINPELFTKYSVKRGLRDLDGRGVLVGLTEIGEVHSYIVDDNEMIPVPGQLFYRGINVEQITKGYLKDQRFGFEETTYLLLFGHLPTPGELSEFENLLGSYRDLPDNFFNDMILKSPTKDIMNSLARSVLALYSYDEEADNTATNIVLKKG